MDDLYCLQREVLLEDEPLLQVTADHTRTAQDIHPCMPLLVCPDTYEMHAETKQEHQVCEIATALQGIE